MDGRELERLAQSNRNWAKTGFSREVPAPVRTTPPTVKREEVIPAVTKWEETIAPAKKAEMPPFKGITAIKIDGILYSIRKPSDSDTLADKFNLELLEFMFCAYGRHGVLPLSDLVGFITRGEWTAAGGKRNLMSYLENFDSTVGTAEKEQSFLPVKILVTWPEGTEYLSNGPFFDKINQGQFDNMLADLIVKGLDFDSTRQGVKDMIDRFGFAIAFESKLLCAWLQANEQELCERISPTGNPPVSAV